MKTNRKCPVCSRTYEADITRLKHGRQTTCSRDCSYALRADQLKHSISMTCAICGLDFTRPLSQVKGKYGAQFCSPACHYRGRTLGKSLRIVQKPYNISEAARVAWREGAKKTRKTRIERDNYKHTEASKARLRDANCRAIAEGRINTSSELEKKAVPVLDSMGVEYVAQFPVRDSNGRFVCVFDFFIPVHKVAVEVNGTFWHSDPRLYPQGPVHSVQKRNAIKWAQKLVTAQRLGYRVVELWEKDIKERGDEYIRQTLAPFVT